MVGEFLCQVLVNFYRVATENILTRNITTWHVKYTEQHWRPLQWVINTCSCYCHFDITFGWYYFTEGPNNTTAKCNICSIKIKEAGFTTSSVISHLKLLMET